MNRGPHDSSDPATQGYDSDETDAIRPTRVERAHGESLAPGRGPQGSQTIRSPESDADGHIRIPPSPAWDSDRERHSSRIPGKPAIDPSDTLLEAFHQADAEKAYMAALELQKVYYEALGEAARLRFKVNFGTQVCHTCDGLRAGPGVSATCFQVKKCEYGSIKESSTTRKLSSLLRILADDE